MSVTACWEHRSPEINHRPGLVLWVQIFETGLAVRGVMVSALRATSVISAGISKPAMPVWRPFSRRLPALCQASGQLHSLKIRAGQEGGPGGLPKLPKILNPGGFRPSHPQPSRAMQEGVDAFLEEAVVRRELSDNFCFYEPNYDSLSCCAGWAKESLNKHKSDEREYVYSW